MSIDQSRDEPEQLQQPSLLSWRGAPTLRGVEALNGRCLELLATLARSDRQKIALPMVDQYRSLWRGLNGSARVRAARMPILLMDVHFQDAHWWRMARDPKQSGRRMALHTAAFTGRIGTGLMREILMLAWGAVAVDRGIASVLLGMAPSVTNIFAELGPPDVERIALRFSRHVRPRWQDLPAFWGKLLAAARECDEDAIEACRLHGVQLIGSELVSSLDGCIV